MTTLDTVRPLSRWERAAVIAFLSVLIPLGYWVVHRAAFMERRMGDVGVYFRSAWAVRTGANLYTIADENDFHYVYPPFFAIAMTPLADAPAGEPRPLMLPFAVSVFIWYVVSVGCIALGIHWLANALEQHALPDLAGRELLGSYRWWALRLLPAFACMIPTGHSLMRGQVNPVVIMCLCAGMAALVRGRSWRAGWWLSWPIAIKVFPAFLLVYPLVQRNWRCLAGCAAGLFVGLVIIPLIFLGPARTVDYYVQFTRMTLAPGLGMGEDDSRSDELTRLKNTDSQSFLAMLHNTIHGDPSKRPPDASPGMRYASYALGSTALLLTLWSGRWGRRPTRGDVPLYLGALVLVMLFLCPVCHLHYYSMAIPLFMGLLASAWRQQLSPRFSWGLAILIAMNIMGNILPNLPAFVALRERGFATYPALILWATALAVLWRHSRAQADAVLIARLFPNRQAA
jgi:alpha-1,2-mannosyltransferase